MNIFNYFEEIINKCKLPITEINNYNIVNISGKIVYIEGQRGLLKLSSETISCKLKKGFVEIKGTNLFIKELTNSTLLIQGKIYKIEVF